MGDGVDSSNLGGPALPHHPHVWSNHAVSVYPNFTSGSKEVAAWRRGQDLRHPKDRVEYIYNSRSRSRFRLGSRCAIEVFEAGHYASYLDRAQNGVHCLGEDMTPKPDRGMLNIWQKEHS
jgi:hypothetical protein